ncbi:MGH1-like glycoside hydrolase domain-containing protein [Oleiharenicola sp. Vm1]|uniref:MGH1-like glycoside hydrolase domain-containing protein n=1 Tax=Oleiharenicola sp. Vm1 TaxID=3398393 RepID=UPI0039F50364
MSPRRLLFVALLAACPPVVARAAPVAEVIASHVARFNAMEDEGVVNAVPNAASADWLQANVPAFTCADAEVEEIYWFRWWSLRKHLKRDEASGRWVFTEFITKPRPISSALGHHLMELRWLREQGFADDYVQYWLHGSNSRPQPHLHKYSQWLAYAVWQRALVTGDMKGAGALLDDLVSDYRAWEKENGRPDGLFWQYDVRDAMEESISGGRKVKNVRPTISCYMAGNAAAIAALARAAGRTDVADEFAAKAARLRRLVLDTLWDPERAFFTSRTEALERIPVREAIGFIPWYFHLPEPGRGYEVAWKQLTDEHGFKAPAGLTTAERRDPTFRTRGIRTCEWDGAVWPFATAQTLTALANVLRDYPQDAVTARDYFAAFMTYVRSQRYDGRPYIGEYLDEKTGEWIMGANPRSRFYNHSTFADLLIADLIGLRPRADNVVEVAPLLPADAWAWFRLERVRYHGHELALEWDRDGRRFGIRGFRLFVDGQLAASAPSLTPLTASLPAP